MKRPAKWKIITVTVVFGVLHLLGVAFAMVKPHVAGGKAVSVSVYTGAPLAAPVAAVRSCPDAGGSTTHSQTRTGLRGLRAATDRRAGDSAGSAARYSVHGTSSSR